MIYLNNYTVSYILISYILKYRKIWVVICSSNSENMIVLNIFTISLKYSDWTMWLLLTSTYNLLILNNLYYQISLIIIN